MHGTKGMIPLSKRKPLTKGETQCYRSRADNYRFLQCRKTFKCHNEQCDKRVVSYCDYYYKYEGALDWNYRYYNLWNKVCIDCYFDHVVDPNSKKWINHMTAQLEHEGRRLDNNREEMGMKRSVPVVPRRR